MELYKNNLGDLMWVLPIPKDGNCLFGALAHQLYGVTPSSDLFPIFRDQLRKNAVGEIRSHLPHYFLNLVTNAAGLPGNASLKEKVETFLVKLEQPGFWGGEESIAALANCHSTRIIVEQDGTKITYSPRNTTAISECHILYRGQTQVRNHYDSVLCSRLRQSVLGALAGKRVDIVRPTVHTAQMEVLVVNPGRQSLESAILHQLTREEAGVDICSNLRCLIAEEIERQDSTTLTSLGIPSDRDALENYTFHVRTGLNNGGDATLILLSSILRVTIYLHKFNEPSVRLDPADRRGTLTIHLYRNAEGDYSSVLRLMTSPESVQVPQSQSRKESIYLADKVWRKEQEGSQPDVASNLPIGPQGLRLSSLNVNGCRTIQKRNEIDALLHQHQVHVAVLQEANLPCDKVLTEHYEWNIGGRAKNRRRGLAILLNRSYQLEIWLRKNIHCDLQYVQLIYKVSNKI